MYKVDKVKYAFDCDVCKKLLIDPVVIQCGNFICKSHVDNLCKQTSDEKNTFICGFCHDEHFIPQKGFVVNNRLQSLLSLQLNTLTPSPLFDDCKKEIAEAKRSVAKIEQLKESAETFSFEYFEDIKRQVDLRREQLKVRIDNYSDDIIKSVEHSQKSCLKLSKAVTQIAAKIENSKYELNGLIRQFDTLDIHERKYEEVKRDVNAVNKDFAKLIDELDSVLVGNKKFEFEFSDQSIEDIFGRLNVFGFDLELDSVILDERGKKSLHHLCELPAAKKWKLMYRASRDGFHAKHFHAKCDGVKNTLTVIKSPNCIFGGFTEKAWSSSIAYVADPKAFVFSLVNKENRPFKVPCANSGQKAIFTRATYGPTFGGGFDIKIMSNSNVNQDSYCNFGSSYKHPDYLFDTDKAKNILAGSHNFQPVEIEVFAKPI